MTGGQVRILKFIGPCIFDHCFNLLPDDKLLGLAKLNAFADEKLNDTQNIKVTFIG